MTHEPQRRGPKPKGKPRRKVIAFGVSPEHHDWLTALPNRSAWLAEQIENSRKLHNETALPNE
jgi:hypothetical protein